MPHKHCDYGGGLDSAACIYRFAHNFGSGTSWYFETQNMVGNVSPNGRWAVFTSDWFAGVGNWPLGCTNGTASPCEDNVTANGNNNVTITAASETSTTATFTTSSISGYSPSSWPVGTTVYVTGMVPTGWNCTGGCLITASTTTPTVTFSITLASGLGPATGFGKANLECSAEKTSPCPRGDVFVVDLLSAH